MIQGVLSNYGHTILTQPDLTLAQIDNNHRVYLCQCGLVHLVWEQDRLPLCPGDFVGLPFQLSGLEADCDKQCWRGEPCEWLEDGSRVVHLRCGSFQLPLLPEACRRMQSMLQEAVNRLCVLRQNGFFSVQKWGPPQSSGAEGLNISAGELCRLNWHDQPLAKIDNRHQAYLCEYGLVHLVWGQEMLPFCPGDFAGLPGLLSGLKKEGRDRQCLHDKKCRLVEDKGGMKYFQYGSFRLSLNSQGWRQIRGVVQEAAGRLLELRQVGYFSMQA